MWWRILRRVDVLNDALDDLHGSLVVADEFDVGGGGDGIVVVIAAAYIGADSGDSSIGIGATGAGAIGANSSGRDESRGCCVWKHKSLKQVACERHP